MTFDFMSSSRLFIRFGFISLFCYYVLLFLVAVFYLYTGLDKNYCLNTKIIFKKYGSPIIIKFSLSTVFFFFILFIYYFHYII